MPAIALFKILVDDLDDALVFYTDKLGMTCLEDNRLGEYRWILVGFPDQKGVRNQPGPGPHAGGTGTRGAPGCRSAIVQHCDK